MRAILFMCLIALAGDAYGQSSDLPLADKRLPVSTLVREDIFAGWRANDLERFARAEKNIELLLEQRPGEKAELLSWKGGTKLYRGLIALEAGNVEEFERYYQESLDLFAEAKKLSPKHPAVAAIAGGSFVFFGDKLPEKYREYAWTTGYDNYKILWAMQGKALERLPVHIRGELLAGLAQSSERLGRKEETVEHLDKIIEVLPDTGYERMAKEWKADPTVAAKGNISCKSCHNDGRLSQRLANLKDK
jgi:tetratricopeptide (TPR) repeat protein